MADENGRLGWYSADPRGVLELNELHVPKRLQRVLRQGPFDIRVDTAFRAVMEGCAHRDSTWISPQIVDAYCKLHQRGKAHSVEAWQDGELAGGLYGVTLGGAYFGESMFAARPDASKVCLVHLVERLRTHGFKLLDCQMVTPHMARFGARLIAAQEYLRRLQEALTVECSFL